MTTTARPLSDRKGRVYTPAVGPRLRPCSGSSSAASPSSGATASTSPASRVTWWTGTTQQTFFYMLMVVLHLVLGFGLIVPFLVFGFGAPGHLVEAAEQGGGPLRPGAPGAARWSSWSRAWSWSGSGRSRSATRPSGRWATGCTSSRRCVAVGLYVKHRLAGPRIRWVWARRFGRRSWRRASSAMARPALAGPAVVRREGAEGGEAVLLPVRGGHRRPASSSRPRP